MSEIDNRVDPPAEMLDAQGLSMHLSVEEADALAVLDTLLGLVRADTVRGPSRLEVLRPGFAALAQRHIAVAVTRWLVESGGHRERSVLRDDLRAKGRVWDSEINRGWAPMFSAATTEFWLACAKQLPTVESDKPEMMGEAPARRKRRTLKDMSPRPTGTLDGDWLFFHLCHRTISGFAINADEETLLLRSLRRSSPLAGLFALDMPEASVSLATEKLLWLFANGTVRMLECAQDRLAQSWEQSIAGLWARTDTVANLLPLWRTSELTLRAYIAAASGARRADLLRPVLRFLSGLATRVFVGGSDHIRRRVVGLPGWSAIRERDEMLAAVRAIPELGRMVQRARDELAAERYGDERYEESQVLLAAYADEFAASRAALDDVVRALSNTVG
ncbi:MAG: hypothetical protein Q8Q09_02985 [Deltaproteobacteria bacterium]|nr:hypothetical protein [Deltaproteobacteria bacterium]